MEVARLRILVVEDEETIADVIATKLRCEKYEVDTSFDGEDGLYNAMTNIYDLIILDIMLPKMNGCESHHAYCQIGTG